MRSNYGALRDMHQMVCALLDEADEGSPRLPLPDERARVKILSEMHYRSGRLGALMCLPQYILNTIDVHDISLECDAAWSSVEAARTLSYVYRQGDDWQDTQAAKYYGLAYERVV